MTATEWEDQQYREDRYSPERAKRMRGKWASAWAR
jgi:hypothetical protein